MEPCVATPAEYYGAPNGVFIRADITFLRQDFSIMQRVSNPEPWPESQRYDFVVRTRQATADEVSRVEKGLPEARYPQREAIQYALRQLDGEATGTPGTNDW